MMSFDLYRLTATEVSAKIKAGEVSVEDYAKSLLQRIDARDEDVQAWAYLDAEYVIKQAKALDAIPPAERGALHGVAIAVKDVIYTKGELAREDANYAITELTSQICPHSSTRQYMPTTLPKSMLALSQSFAKPARLS
jgi:hypothetical protein